MKCLSPLINGLRLSCFFLACLVLAIFGVIGMSMTLLWHIALLSMQALKNKLLPQH